MSTLLRTSLLMFFCAVLSVSAYAEYAQFSYTGRVKVQGQPFDGTGQFKFAITDNAGTISLWSNDSTSAGGSEPTSALSFSVIDGVVSVLVGDTAEGFDPINRTVFNHPEKIKLRVWFSDGSHGFQQLTPDMKLVNVDLLGLETGTEDFTVYVDATSGNDANDGLSTSTAKQTVQAAIDILPQRINSNVTVKIFSGTYREEALVYGLDIRPGKTLTISGDDSWTSASLSDPLVRITGSDSSVSESQVRSTAMTIISCNDVRIEGILFDYATAYAAKVSDSTDVTFERCKFSQSDAGLYTEQTVGYVYDCVATDNVNLGHGYGFWFSNSSWIGSGNNKAANNGGYGMMVQNNGFISIHEGHSIFSDNTGHGVAVTQLSRVNIFNGATAEVNNNTSWGIREWYIGLVIGIAQFSFSGNTLGSYTGTNIY